MLTCGRSVKVWDLRKSYLAHKSTATSMHSFPYAGGCVRSHGLTLSFMSLLYFMYVLVSQNRGWVKSKCRHIRSLGLDQVIIVRPDLVLDFRLSKNWLHSLYQGRFEGFWLVWKGAKIKEQWVVRIGTSVKARFAWKWPLTHNSQTKQHKSQILL